ncbi:hypothetical protein ACUY4R_001444 [Kosakonia sp. BK9b]
MIANFPKFVFTLLNVLRMTNQQDNLLDVNNKNINFSSKIIGLKISRNLPNLLRVAKNYFIEFNPP